MHIFLYRKTYVVGVILVISLLHYMNTEEVCGNADLKRVPQTGLSQSKYWNSKSQDFEQCAKLCIRQKKCRSVTYDTESRWCDLNTGTMTDTPTRSGATLVYSEFVWWPSSLDKNCYGRPCADSESCVPGTLLTAGSTDCSYSCLTFSRDVCPLPPWGVTNGRTVGSVNTYTCGKGTLGGGTAKCLPTKEWDKEITPICTDILDHPCNASDDPCPLINGRCSQGHCICGPNKQYNTNTKECFLECGSTPDVPNAQLLGNTNNRTYECEQSYYPTASSEATLTCTETGWQPDNKFSCFTCGNPEIVIGASVKGSGQERQYVCNANDATHLYPNPKTGNGTIICDEKTQTWTPADFKCGGLRLKPSHPAMANIPNSGYLEIFANDEWRAVTYEHWDWKATKVACKTLGFSFGGTFHKDWYDNANPDRLPYAYKLDGIDCTGEEEKLELCPTFNPKDGSIDKEVALTCFDTDIKDNVVLRPGPENGEILVKLASSDTLSSVCGDDWDDKVTKVVCRTINSVLQRDRECKSDCGVTGVRPFLTNHIDCEGDEPHLFYCENRGWGYNTSCSSDKFVTVVCKL